jgi:coenzyme Q-binding protein COQ10
MILKHKEKRLLPYSQEQLFELVMDIEKYPEFLPWCLHAEIYKRKKGECEAGVVIGYKIFREEFVSRVHYTKHDHILVEYMKGPLRHLHNEWHFTPKGKNKCEVSFEVSFELRSRLLQALMEQFFNRAVAKMVSAFEQRAKDLYG